MVGRRDLLELRRKGNDVNCTNCEHSVGVHGVDGCRVTGCRCPFGQGGVPPKAADKQVGGSHYRDMAIQPWAVIDAFGLGYYDGSALKYLLRAGRKGPRLEDLEKARHCLDKLIEIEEGKG